MFRSRPRSSSRNTSARFAPRLDALEPRELLATFTVTSPDDAGPGTLRQAVLDANARPGADVIRFNGGLNGQTITLTSGTIVISDDLNIKGPGAGRLTVSGGGTGGIFAALPVELFAEQPPLQVKVSDLTLADGLVTTFDFPNIGAGAAIFAYRTDLVVEDAVFRDNESFSGGAISIIPGQFVDEETGVFGFIPGSLTIDDSRFDSNRAGTGGAISFNDTPVRITDSRFTGNTSGGSGGAIYGARYYVADAVLTVEDSEFQANVASGFLAQGGAIYNAGAVVIDDSLFTANRAEAEGTAVGGALYNASGAEATIDDSRFVGNSATASGQFGGFAYGGAIGSDPGARALVTDSRFEDNRAAARLAAQGGAISHTGLFGSPGGDGTLTIDGSTFTGNAALGLDADPSNPFGGASAQGGAVYNNGPALAIADSVFRGNRAVGSSSDVGSGGAAGGGAVSHQGASVTLADTRFEDNEARAGLGGSGSFFAALANGGAVDLLLSAGQTALLADVRFDGNAAIGGGNAAAAGPGGIASGGALALFGGTAHNLTDVRFTDNRAEGGDGGPGGAGGEARGGALYLSAADGQTTIVDARFTGNSARGGDGAGGTAGAARGGALYSSGSLAVRDAQFSANRAIGGDGASGGDAEGGAIWAAIALALEDVGIHGNRADAGPAGRGLGGGVFLAPGTTAAFNKKVKLTGNKASTAGDQLYSA